MVEDIETLFCQNKDVIQQTHQRTEIKGGA